MSDQNFRSRSKEIERLISHNELEEAIKKLMDLARDYAKDSKRIRQSIVLSSNYSDVSDDILLYGNNKTLLQQNAMNMNFHGADFDQQLRTLDKSKPVIAGSLKHTFGDIAYPLFGLLSGWCTRR